MLRLCLGDVCPIFFDGIEERGLAGKISTFRTSNNRMSPNPSSHHPTFTFLSFFLETQTSHPSLTQIPTKKCRKHPPKRLHCLPWGAFCWSHFEHLWSGGDLGKGSLNGTHFGGELNKQQNLWQIFRDFPFLVVHEIWVNVSYNDACFQLLEMVFGRNFWFLYRKKHWTVTRWVPDPVIYMGL